MFELLTAILVIQTLLLIVICLKTGILRIGTKKGKHTRKLPINGNFPLFANRCKEEREINRRMAILKNINNYNGTAIGQKPLPKE